MATQWIQTSNIKQNGEPVTRYIDIDGIDEGIWFTTNGYAEVDASVADLLANNIDSITQVNPPSTPGEYYGDVGEQTSIRVIAPDDSFDQLWVDYLDLTDGDTESLTINSEMTLGGTTRSTWPSGDGSGGGGWSVTTAQSNYTASGSELVLADASSGAFNVTLPTPASGVEVRVKKIDSSSNAVGLVTSGTATIDGASSKSISNQWSSRVVQSNGTNYYII